MRGSQLSLLQGANQEYLATSQFSFPAYESFEDTLLPVPDYAVLDSTTACNDDMMEGLEVPEGEHGGLVFIPTAWRDHYKWEVEASLQVPMQSEFARKVDRIKALVLCVQ